MLHYVKRGGIPVSQFRCPHRELNDHLNQYLACLVCNMDGAVRGHVNHTLNRLSPGLGVSLKPGMESMQKNFEVAGAGCAPVADWIEEMTDLGFVDGKTMVSYRSFTELVEKLHYYVGHHEELREIGRNAGILAMERHSWDHRAQQLDNLIATLS